MASAYLEADLGALYRLAELVERQARGDLPATALVALLALEDRFGLSPKSRQLLQWQVLAGEPPAAAAPSSSSGLPTSVRRLRAVDPSASASA